VLNSTTDCGGFQIATDARLITQPSKENLFASIRVLEEQKSPVVIINDDDSPSKFEECDDIPHEKERGDARMSKLVKGRELSRDHKIN